MKLLVDQSQRYAKMRAHTATHLLHAELAKIFKNTKQAGSLVDEDYLRFDFHAERLLSQEEISAIENAINTLIYHAYTVDISEVSYPEAIALGAKAFFEDKYGDMVRLVRVFDYDHQPISLELCGGTHVTNTKDIGCFAIVSQEAVASGVKRIIAVTGPKVMVKMHEVQDILTTTVAKLGIKTATQLVDKLDKTLKEYEDMKSMVESLETKMIKQLLQGSDFSVGKDIDKVFLVPSEFTFKNVVFQAKGLFQNQNILIYTPEGGYVLLTKPGVSAKDFAHRLGISGGGTDTMIQGKDPQVLHIFE